MIRTLTLCAAAMSPLLLLADEPLTIQKVTVNTPSGVISGKVVGTGDNLVFVDDNDPQKSFTLNRGRIRNYTTEKGEILVELERPAFDQPGTQSNVRITVVDPANATALTQWIGLPVERSRSVTTYSTDVRHDHKGKGECNGKLLADDTMLRFESVSEANHSRTWNYNDLQSFQEEKDHSLLKVTAKYGEKDEFKTVNGKTAGALYDIVSQKIVGARSSQQ